MLIAKQKRNENIAEYILYMWQLEDMLRACNFNVEVLMKNFSLPLAEQQKVQQWYQNMADAMRAEGILQRGHLMQLKELVQDLSALNIKLLQMPSEKQYYDLFTAAMPHITEIINHSDGFVKNEIDACFTGLYGVLLLRLQQKSVTENTQQAVKSFSELLAMLSHKYKQYEDGDLEIEF